jgi:hypothetical protein
LTTPRRAVLLRHFRPETPNGSCEQLPPLGMQTAARCHLAHGTITTRHAALPD